MAAAVLAHSTFATAIASLAGDETHHSGQEVVIGAVGVAAVAGGLIIASSGNNP